MIIETGERVEEPVYSREHDASTYQVGLQVLYSSVPAKVHSQQIVKPHIMRLEIFNQTFSGIRVHLRVGGSVIIMQPVFSLLFMRF